MNSARNHLPASVTAARGAPPALAPSTDDPRLAEAVEAYRAALKAGSRPDRQALCAQYPDLAQMLEQCLDALDFLQGAGQDLGSAGSHRPGQAAHVDGFFLPSDGPGAPHQG
jgi:hypothetical protein